MTFPPVWWLLRSFRAPVASRVNLIRWVGLPRLRTGLRKGNRSRTLLPALLLASLLTGCQEMSLTMPTISQLSYQSTAKSEARAKDAFDIEEKNDFRPPFIGDYVSVSGLNLVTLEGVGLVTGLNGTGGDPPPSQYRTQLLDDMRRRDIPDPNRIISSPSTALVIVRAYLPPLVQPGDKFDVEVRIPEGSTTSSLNGGWLLSCRLTERAIVPGKGVLEGKERARAEGPILVSIDEGASAGMKLRGFVVGGGVSLESRDMQLYLNNDVSTVRNSTRIASRIGTRFFSYDRYGHREPLAKAKTDMKINLQIHPNYKDNFPRYVQVIENITFRETDVERQVRIERLQKELQRPETAEKAALQLEAIGTDAIPILKTGLKANNFESRFHSATALAYLEEPDGLQVLFEAARDEPAFRVFALAAMSCIEAGETHIFLRELMDNSLMETRYGAFRCMTTIDDQDPFCRGESLNSQCKLHVLDVLGEPMIHLTHRQKSEIVLFGRGQEFKTPLALTAGPHIMVNSPAGSEKVVVSRYRVGEPDQRKEVSKKISEVLRAAAELGASYPDLAQMLMQAEKQQNLPGSIGIDMLPEAGRFYERKVEGETGGETPRVVKRRIGRETLAPNQYTKGGAANEKATKPLLTSKMEDKDQSASEPEATEKPEPSASAPASGAAKSGSTAAPNEKSQAKAKSAPTDSLKALNPIPGVKKAILPATHGEMLYPKIDED